MEDLKVKKEILCACACVYIIKKKKQKLID